MLSAQRSKPALRTIHTAKKFISRLFNILLTLVAN